MEFGPDGTQFIEPVTLTIAYDPESLDGRSEDSLGIFYWNPKSEKWDSIGSTLDKEAKTVSARVTHFSLYQVHSAPREGPMTSTVEYDSTFKLGEAYAYPNPAIQKNPSLHLECGIADSVEIRIYNEMGERVQQADLRGLPSVINGKYAYEYTLDADALGSGVYLYVIQARKGGETDVRASGKLAIIK
jgi:hypothetical protein